jgi:ribose 5-phosphate isomerase B
MSTNEKILSASRPRLLVASDHAGFDLKEWLKLEMSNEIEWIDLGPDSISRVDYPDFADRLAYQVTTQNERGVLICASGQGMAMRANRYPDVRAALVWNEETVRLAREHNDANVICLGSRLLPAELCKTLIQVFLQTPFEGGRHTTRIEKLSHPVLC